MKEIVRTSEQYKKKLEIEEKRSLEDRTCPECGGRGVRSAVEHKNYYKYSREYYECKCGCRWRTEWRD